MNGILVELQETMGSDTSIANAAWCSTYDKDKREGKYDDPDKVADLVERLITDGHGTPVESVVFRFWIRMPIFIDRQHVTHRLASHNGLSGRYRTMPHDWYNVPEDVKEILNKVNCPGYIDEYEVNCHKAYESYNYQIKKLKEKEKVGELTNAEFKRVREVIRGQLPTAGFVERTTVMNLRSFANYIRQRTDSHAQKEIQFVANEMLRAVKEANVCPTAIATLEKTGWAI